MRGPDTIRLRHGCTIVAICAAVFAAACADASAALSASSRIGPRGVGPIVIGTTPADVRRAGVTSSLAPPARGSSCSYLVPATPAGLRFLVEDGNLRRAEVSARNIATIDGLRVGDAASAVATHYHDRARSAPDKYDPRMQRITIAPARSDDARYRIVFNVRGGAIASIVAGALPQVAYVEGCS